MSKPIITHTEPPREECRMGVPYEVEIVPGGSIRVVKAGPLFVWCVCTDNDLADSGAAGGLGVALVEAGMNLQRLLSQGK